MRIKTTLTMALLVAAPFMYTLAQAQMGPGHEEHRGGPGPGGAPHTEVRTAPRAEVRVAPPAPRAVPPRFQAHPVGPHPHGPIVRPHSVRVLAPRVIPFGNHQTWHHWDHPEFSRPTYYWDWATIRQVTCIAEDSYGDQYPVTETVGAGFGLNSMTGVEDDALDRCNSESGGDGSCYLATCTHY